MKKTLVFTALLAAGTAGYCTQSDVKTFPAAGLKSLSVDTSAGNIRVDGGAKDAVRAEVISDDLSKCEITMKVEGSELVLKAEDSKELKSKGEGFSGSGCGAGFKVSSPSALFVKADTGAGDIAVSGMSG